MRQGYFESLKTYDHNDYLMSAPTKKSALNNAAIDGTVTMLPDANNRAIIIKTDDAIYLQSYDTLILKYTPATGYIEKLWSGYSVTTLKHINIFMLQFTSCYNYFNKKSWLDFKGGVF